MVPRQRGVSNGHPYYGREEKCAVAKRCRWNIDSTEEQLAINIPPRQVMGRTLSLDCYLYFLFFILNR